MPLSVTYFNQEDMTDARRCLKHWSEEWREKKASEMETFNGKRDINEGETASTLSQSRVSNKTGRGQQIAQQSQASYGGMSQRGRRINDGRKGNVKFANDEGSRSPSPEFMREGKDAIRAIDQALADGDDVD